MNYFVSGRRDDKINVIAGTALLS